MAASAPPACPAWLPVGRLAAALGAAAAGLAAQPPTLQVVRADGTVDAAASAAEAAAAVAEWLPDVELLEHAAGRLGPPGLAALAAAADPSLPALAEVAAQRQAGDELRRRVLGILALAASTDPTAAAVLRQCGCHTRLLARQAAGGSGTEEDGLVERIIAMIGDDSDGGSDGSDSSDGCGGLFDEDGGVGDALAHLSSDESESDGGEPEPAVAAAAGGISGALAGVEADEPLQKWRFHDPWQKLIR